MHEPSTDSSRTDLGVLWAIAAVVVLYLASAAIGLPQRGTELAAEAAASHAAEQEHSAEAHAHEAVEPPAYVMVTPFVLLLGAIAIFPLWPLTQHWWESNLHRFYVAAGLGLATLAYYAALHSHSIERHFLGHGLVAPEATVSWQLPWTVFQNAMFVEYIPFIILLFSLYTISGGIRITGDLRAHALTNSTFIAVGALLASFIGTTGAAMLLIRPLLETNSERRHVVHTVVVFIFVVCNCGGCLLPIGDPPLFLGYLEGVPFLWTLSLWPAWLFVNGMLVAVYFLADHFYYYPREEKRDIALDETRVRGLEFGGMWPNALLLAGVVVCVALLDPSKLLPGTSWRPWLYLREIAQLTLVALSLWLGSKAVRQANRFNYAAIIEVAALFFGIFLCMQPALQILAVRGAELGIVTPRQFFWTTGALSSVLDNAPTYLVFFKTAQSLHTADAVTIAGVAEDVLAGISLGAVFLGAMTYIGNGPNFMVKTIAESSGVRMPSFFGYIGYSVVVLLPILVAAAFLFL